MTTEEAVITIFHNWAHAQRIGRGDNLLTFQMASAILRAGYKPTRKGMGITRPWRLLAPTGEVVAQEFYPLAERAATATHALPDTTPDALRLVWTWEGTAAALQGELERRRAAYWGKAERMRAVGEASDAA